MSKQGTEPYQHVSNTALVEQAIIAMQNEIDDEISWDIISELRSRNIDEIFCLASALCAQPTAIERVLGTRLLDLGYYEDQTDAEEKKYIRPKRQQSKPVLEKMLFDESPEVIVAAIHITSHLEFSGELISQRTDLATHANADIRRAMASSIYVDIEAPQKLIDMLIMLMEDRDAEIRDWAVFSLGIQSDASSQHINNALASLLKDKDNCVRIQSAASLFKRGDVRFLKTLEEYQLDDFDASEYSGTLWLDTVGQLASPAFLPKLQYLKKQALKQNHSDNVDAIEIVIRKCKSSQ